MSDTEKSGVRTIADIMNVPTLITGLLMGAIVGSIATYVQVQILVTQMDDIRETIERNETQRYYRVDAERDHSYLTGRIDANAEDVELVKDRIAEVERQVRSLQRDRDADGQ